jgi:hypothetical protein
MDMPQTPVDEIRILLAPRLDAFAADLELAPQ